MASGELLQQRLAPGLSGTHGRQFTARADHGYGQIRAKNPSPACPIAAKAFRHDNLIAQSVELIVDRLRGGRGADPSRADIEHG
jgi:hypothetical protein